MYIIMPNKLPNTQNTYPYPINRKAKAKAKANYNLVIAMQRLGIKPDAYIQPHHTPKPSRASITKKPRPLPGAWKGKAASNGIPIGESFSENQLMTAINEKALKYDKHVKRMRRRKPATLPVTVGGNVNIKQRKKAFERNKNQKPNVRARVNSKRLSSNMLKLFQGAAPVPTQLPHSSRNGRVFLTVR